MVDILKDVATDLEGAKASALMSIHAKLDAIEAAMLTPSHLALFATAAFVIGFIAGRLV